MGYVFQTGITQQLFLLPLYHDSAYIVQPAKKSFATHHWDNKKIIAAVSGGADSMALCYVLKHLDIEFVIAHCNFQLRGEESNQDEAFVRDWAEENNIPCYVQKFETKNIITTTKGNLQDTCRRLRYDWFEELRVKLGFNYIAIAHHKDDVVETILMNLMKGTGIAGLHGILPVQHKIIRPLLGLEKMDLVQILHAHDCKWREDSSNEKDNYLRNKIRHHVIPAIVDILPHAVDNIYKTSLRVQDIEAITKKELQKTLLKLTEQRGNDFYISINKLIRQGGYATLLYEIVKPFGFSSAQMSDIAMLLEAHTGKFVANDTYRIIKNRDFLIITAVQTTDSDYILIEDLSMRSYVFPHGMLSVQAGDRGTVEQSNSKYITVDADNLELPLILRPYKTGDYFYPLGMGMKKKKISKLLKDLKIALHEKEQVWVVESNKKIVWVLGIRMDERFKVNSKTKKAVMFGVM